MSRRKVFGIGLSKTGTNSLNEALRLLGYRAEHFFFDLDRIEQLDAATDTPIARAYLELDRKYPGSKFILTLRDLPSWLESCRRQFTAVHTRRERRDLRLDVYGVPAFEEGPFRRAYHAHRAEVRGYFRGRRRDYLEMDIIAGDGWEKLCPFLGQRVPDHPFPHLNPREEDL